MVSLRFSRNNFTGECVGSTRHRGLREVCHPRARDPKLLRRLKNHAPPGFEPGAIPDDLFEAPLVTLLDIADNQ
jgi:hypothetical protein